MTLRLRWFTVFNVSKIFECNCQFVILGLRSTSHCDKQQLSYRLKLLLYWFIAALATRILHFYLKPLKVETNISPSLLEEPYSDGDQRRRNLKIAGSNPRPCPRQRQNKNQPSLKFVFEETAIVGEIK